MLSSAKQQHHEFWNKFKEYVHDNDKTLQLSREAQPRNQYLVNIEGIPNKHARIKLTVNSREKNITCRLVILNDQNLLQRIYNDRVRIKSEIDGSLDYRFLEGHKQSQLVAQIDIDPTNEKNWEECFQWLMERTKEFKKVFPPYFS